MPFTPDIIAALKSIGLREPAAHPWRQLPNVSEPVLHSCYATCACVGHPLAIAGVPFTRGSANMIIHQCPFCLRVTWCHWLREDGQWIGPRRVQAEEIHSGLPVSA
jgi:hypothetical protein